MVAWHTTGVKTIEDGPARSSRSGRLGPTPRALYAQAMNALLGTKFKIITGYPGGAEINLAMEKGEVDVRGSNSWSSWKGTRPQWLAREEDQLPGADRPRARSLTCRTCRC